MEVLRFGLGMRFDLLGDVIDEESTSYIFGRLFSILDAKSVRGLKLFAGHIDDDEKDIYTVAFTNGGSRQMRKLFLSIDGYPFVRNLLSNYRPYVQTNALCHVEGLTYFGEFDKRTGVFYPSEADEVVPYSDIISSYIKRDFPKRKANGEGYTFVLAPDKFKGSLTSEQAIASITRAARRRLPGARIIPVPIGDGGDGTASALVRASNGTMHNAIVTAPHGERITASYGMIDSRTAIIEMAQASGLSLVPDEARNPMKNTSFGTGELILHALNEGMKHIIIAIGGSATNDGGMGAAHALGVKFLDCENNELMGCGEDMQKVHSIDLSGMDERLKDVDIKVLCDVCNPLTGIEGATMVYGQQKGADKTMLEALENGMKKLEKLYNEHCGSDVCSEPGAGAAGGMGAMLRALMGAKLVRGAETVLEATHFDDLLDEADLVITGEGRLDASSVLYGKTVASIISRAIGKKVPVLVLTGSRSSDFEDVLKLFKELSHPIAIAPIADSSMSLEYAMEHADSLIDMTSDRFFTYYKNNVIRPNGGKR